MSKRLLATIIAIAIVVVVILVWYFLVYLPSKSKVTSQAFTVSSVPSSTLPSSPVVQPIAGIPFYVYNGSALAQYAYQPLTVVQGPIFIGDSAWLILQTPQGNYIAEVMDVVSAEQVGVGTTIVAGSTITPIPI